MTSWTKYNLLFLIFLNTISWAEPSTSGTIRSLDDTELRNMTDHNHGDMKADQNKDHHSKDKQLRNDDSRQQNVINRLMLGEPKASPMPSK